MEETKNVIDYYDNFIFRQKKVGLNMRHREIILDLRKAGLKKHHNVLELGCGIGLISGELSNYVIHGQVLGVDISADSINFASNRYAKKKNLRFIASDISKLALDEIFDMVIMPDILEHIPVELHQELYIRVRKLVHNNSILFIHIPQAPYLEYLTKYEPQHLQIIDQAIESRILVDMVEMAGFELIKFNSYSLTIKEGDYRKMVFKVKQPLIKIHTLSYFQNALKELKYRITYFIKIKLNLF